MRRGECMGYDLQITRGGRAPVGEQEWRSYVAADPEFELTGVAETPTPDGVLRYENPGLACWSGHPGGEQVWFDFRRGRVVVKNPDEPTIAKMIEVARALGARVEGDDGEVYESPGAPPRSPRGSLVDRVCSWFGRLRPIQAAAPVACEFATGQRVRDALGRAGTVIAIDARANHGLGAIAVRFDDGRELTFAAVASGLEPIAPRGDG